MEIVYTALLFLLLLISASIGWIAQRRLQERHVSKESVESIRLLMGMLLTFSALVLGLLTSNAKQRYDGFDLDLSAYAVNLVELDHSLRLYGPEANELRVQLRRYTAAALADTWPKEPPPPGTYPRFTHVRPLQGVEGTELGQMLADVDVGIARLTPTDEFRRKLAARLMQRATEANGQRWRLIFSARSTISWPFLLVLTSWLSIIFAIFGLTSPRSRLVYAVVGLSALSIASPLYLIIVYSEAQTGLLNLTSTPMRAALAHMDQPQ